MPAFSEELVASLITSARISVISVDTSILQQYGFNLNSPAIQGLKRFSGTSIVSMLSSVVLSEVKDHLRQDAQEARDKLDVALRAMRDKHYEQADGVTSTIGETPETIAERIATRLTGELGFGVLDPEPYVKHEEILRRYFDALPPFANAKNKKHEFPDAFALLSIEGYVHGRK